MGTSQDMLDLLGGDAARLAELETRVAAHLGFDHVLTSVGQVYPRSLDFDVVSALVQLAAGPSNLATTIRLMAGIELVTEGFKEGQVGSSAMPHKMNTRSCERVNGLAVVLRGYLSMVGELAGDQWNEGDVSCSVVRRVALPDAFFAVDGLFQTFLTVLDEFGAFPAVIQRELDRYLPFLATTKVLMAAVRKGVGREAAHEAIKEDAVGVALDMRQGQAENDLFDRLAADERLGLTARADRRPGRRADRVHRRRRRAGRGPSSRGSRSWRPPTPRPRRTPRAPSSDRPAPGYRSPGGVLPRLPQPAVHLVVDLADVVELEVVHPHLRGGVHHLLEPRGRHLARQGDGQHGRDVGARRTAPAATRTRRHGGAGRPPGCASPGTRRHRARRPARRPGRGSPARWRSRRRSPPVTRPRRSSPKSRNARAMMDR